MNIDRVTVIYFVALIVAVILHEIAHGVVALWFGDDTAKRAGRLTLNPVPHIDPLGSIILPALVALAHIPGIAWAKPVPVNPARLRHQRRDMLFVSLAGPAMNFLLASVAAVATRAMVRAGDTGIVVDFVWYFAVVNLFLGVFNFLPIPPLDGAALIERVLPREWLPGWYRFRQYGFLVLFLLVFATGFPSRVFQPFLDHLRHFVTG